MKSYETGERASLPSIRPAVVARNNDTELPAYPNKIRQPVVGEVVASTAPPLYTKVDKAPVRNLNLAYDSDDSGDDKAKIAFDALRAANLELHTTLTDATEALELLRLDNEEERRLNDQLATQNATLLKQISVGSDDSTRGEIELLVNQLNTAMSDNSALRSEVRERTACCEDLRRELTALQKGGKKSSLTDEVLHRNEILTQQVLALTKCAEESQQRSASDTKKLSDQISELSRENQLLSAKVEDNGRLQVENGRLRTQLSSLTDTKESDIELLDQLQLEVTSLRQQLHETKSELASAEAAVVDARAKHTRCQKCSSCSQSRSRISLTSSEEALLKQAEQQLTTCGDYLTINDGFDMHD